MLALVLALVLASALASVLALSEQGTLSAIERIVEDMTRDPKDFMAHENVPREEVSEEIYGEPIVTLFPVLLRFFASPYPRHRKHAVIACNHFIAGRPGHPVFENLILPYNQGRAVLGRREPASRR